MDLFTARIATSSDSKRVARLCRRAVGSGDYALSILKELIADHGLFLAFHGDDLVGMANFDRCIDGSGWLSVARTDPDWRGRGVAVFLQREISAYARRRGIPCLRLWTYAKNKPALSACRKGGFKPVCEAMHVSCNLRKARKKVRTAPMRALSKRSASSLMHSNYLRKMNGYLAYNWHFVRASRRLLKSVVRRREMYLLGDTAFIMAKPEHWGHRRYSNLTVLSGSAATSLQTIKETAQERGLDFIGTYIPYDRYLAKTSGRLGFRLDRWGKHCLVMEKKVR